MLKTLAQFTRDRLLATPTDRSLRHQLRSKLLFRTERLIQLFGDPLVSYPIAGARIELPLSHLLPHIRRSCPEYSSNVGRIAACVAAKYADMTAIDIGANVGDTVAILRARARFPILCIDGDARFFPILQANTRQFGDDVVCVQAYVGDEDGAVQAAVHHEHGTARIKASPAAHDANGDGGRDGGGDNVGQPDVPQVDVRRLSSIVAAHPRFARAKFLKVDTDGFDAKILRGSRDFWAGARPVMFFEYDPRLLAAAGDPGLSLFPVLASAGYRRLIGYDNLGALLEDVEVTDEAELRRLHESCGLPGQPGYIDIAAFHEDDEDLFGQTLAAERRPRQPDTAAVRPPLPSNP